jgi:hypothetical protein
MGLTEIWDDIIKGTLKVESGRFRYEACQVMVISNLNKKKENNNPSYMKSNSEPQEKQGTLFHGDELCLIGQVHNPQGPENKSKDET